MLWQKRMLCFGILIEDCQNLCRSNRSLRFSVRSFGCALFCYIGGMPDEKQPRKAFDFSFVIHENPAMAGEDFSTIRSDSQRKNKKEETK